MMIQYIAHSVFEFSKTEGRLIMLIARHLFDLSLALPLLWALPSNSGILNFGFSQHYPSRILTWELYASIKRNCSIGYYKHRSNREWKTICNTVVYKQHS